MLERASNDWRRCLGVARVLILLDWFEEVEDKVVFNSSDVV